MNSSEKKFAVLGAGVMGGILTENLSKLYGQKNLIVCDVNEEKLKQLKKKFSQISTSDKITDLVQADFLFLAIKPQDFNNLDLPVLKKTCVAVSIMAGVSIKKIKAKTKLNKVVRAMPNTAAKVGKALTVWLVSPQVKADEKAIVQKLWQSFGQEIKVSSEDMINKATAASGSGPAYVFNAFANFADAVQKLGFSKDQAVKLVLQVFDGSLDLLKKENADAKKLISQVASKGGTTEVALKVFNKSNTAKIWQKAINAAYQRAKQLSK
jgi:pyrroline-5-carboxylate reductase